MVGVKIPRVGVKITRGSLTPGGQAAQGVKINCYTGTSRPKTISARDSSAQNDFFTGTPRPGTWPSYKILYLWHTMENK